MKAAATIAIALGSALVGVAAAGWALRTAAVPPQHPGASAPSGYTGAAVPLGELAGGLPPTTTLAMANPSGDTPAAEARGKLLYRAMNCAGCHGYDGSGGMGPPLSDSYWRYGGAPVQVYKTLYEGRPQGMPAWGAALPASDLWAVVAYVRTLGGSVPASHARAAMAGDDTRGKTDRAGSPTLEGQ